VGNVHTATTALFGFLRQVGAVIAKLLSDFEYLLRDQLLDLGVPRTAQTVILVAIMALLTMGAVRLLVGLIRVAVVLVLVLIAIHFVLPLFPS
jgi:hypothetical protein